MKKLRSAILPLVIATVGVGSTFATTTNKNANSVDIQGYLFRPNEVEQCQPVSKFCDNNGAFDCTVSGPGTEALRIFNGTSCPNILKHSVAN